MAQTKLAALYERDEAGWLEKSVKLIRTGSIDKLDFENLAEFLESMAISERRSVRSRMVNLMAHLLKWEHQPSRRSRSWELSILNERDQLQQLCSSKTLRAHAEVVLDEAYRVAVRRASVQTRLSEDVFPSDCPYTVEQLLEDD